MYLAQGPQRSDADKARTCGPSVSSQALYHWATALPTDELSIETNRVDPEQTAPIVWPGSTLFAIEAS